MKVLSSRKMMNKKKPAVAGFLILFNIHLFK
jgi:hypothetical protein